MASSMMFVQFIILVEIHIIAGTFSNKFVYSDDIDDVLVDFSFGWTINETKHVNCFHGSNKIGECYDLYGYKCFLNSTRSCVYSMSTNADLTVVNVTIITFSDKTSGNYSCSKNTGTTTNTICVQKAVSTTSTSSAPKTAAPTGVWPKVCQYGRAVAIAGALCCALYVVLVTILIKRNVWGDLCKMVSTKTSLWWTNLLLVIVSVGSVIFEWIVLETSSICKDGDWSKLNVPAIVGGIIGVILPTGLGIATIIAQSMHWVSDLHHGLVLSHMAVFMRYADKLSPKCEKFKKEKGASFIKRFLLVIPNNCKLILPEQNLTPSAEDALMFEEEMDLEGDTGVYKVRIYKLQMEDKIFYVCAEVPTVLTVISELFQNQLCMIIVYFVRRRFQLLYQNKLKLNYKGLDDTVKLVTCKGKEDIARALFEAAKQVVAESKKENASQPTCCSGLMTCGTICQVTPRDTILTEDMITGLAWNYVNNYLIKQKSRAVSALEPNTKIREGCIKKMIIVWVSTCNTELSWMDLINKCFKPSYPGLKILDPSGQESSKLNRVMFQHQEAAIWAEYCTTMHRINLMNNTSAEKQAYGKRFKEAFEEIMSKTSIKQHFTDIEVSLTYYDVTPQDTILTEDIIPGLAWDYVYNYLMNQKKVACTAFSGLESNKTIPQGCDKKMIIFWVSTCNFELSLMDLVNKCDKPSDPRLESVYSSDNGVVFQHLDAAIWAEYCTPMHCINSMKNTSAKNHAYGKRFKEAFDEIMSKTSIKQQFADIDVSLIYYDDRPFYEI